MSKTLRRSAVCRIGDFFQKNPQSRFDDPTTIPRSFADWCYEIRTTSTNPRRTFQLIDSSSSKRLDVSESSCPVELFIEAFINAS